MLRHLLAAGALAATIGSATAAPAVQALTTFSILADMTHRVGGERVAVTTLVGPDADAHAYEPSPNDVTLLAKSDILVANGLGFETWLTRIVRAAGFKGQVVIATRAVTPLRPAKAGPGAPNDAADVDPHAFQDLRNAALYVGEIRDGLCRADPPGCAAYGANATAYQGEILALDAEIRNKLAAIPAERRWIMTTHDAFGYFGASYGVGFRAAQGLSTEAEATATDIAAIIREIKARKVTTLFLESGTDGRLVAQIAHETGATADLTLHADALARTGPAATYLGMMRSNVDLMLKAMAGKP